MRKIVISAIIAIVFAITAALGVLSDFDLSIQDRLYQRPRATLEDIVLIGIDEKSFEAFGPYQDWDRSIIASVVDTLNQSEQVHPAVICLDVLYAGQRDEDSDSYLAKTCSRYDNVVAASSATFGADIVTDESGNDSFDPNAILAYEEPFDELKNVVSTGTINAMMDKDGVIRHHCLWLDLPDGRRADSMALVAAKKFNQYRGLNGPSLPKVNSKNLWYLSFFGKPGDYSESISVADVYYEDIPAEYFDDKIVLIGPYATGMMDSYITSIDHSDSMYGVEILANAISALLEEDYKTEIPGILQWILLFLSLLFSLIVFLNKSMKISSATWVGEIVLFCALSLCLYKAGFIWDIIYFPLFVTISYIGCIVINYVKSVVEKRAVTNTFKRYVAPEVVNEILKEGTDSLGLGGKVERIAVLFVDVRGFTTMSENLNPKQVVSILNDYLTLIADCIIKNGGTLDKFVGDAAMAIWGAPLECDDYVFKAVKAAKDMVKGSGKLSELLMEKYGRSVSFGVGVHVGEAVVGNMGSPMRMDFTAIGDTVNTAARLEANAPAGTVYISRAVADELGERIKVKSLGDTIKLKGKAEGFEVLELEEILEL